MVKNLRPEEIEVTDDGVVRKVRSFRSVGSVGSGGGDGSGSDPTGLTAARSAVSQVLNPTLTPGKETRLVTLVFDQLLPSQRMFAKQAASELVKSPGRDVLFAFFRIDQSLKLLESYTSDPERIRVAIERATNPSYFLNIDEESRIAKNQTTAALAEQLLAMKTATAASGQYTTTDQRITQMTLNMLQFADAGEQKEQSRAQLVALWALVKEQQQLPGRKTLVYFTGGMNVPPEYNERFQAIVADANLANVTVYAINAGGISTYLGNTSGNLLLEQAGASSHTNMVDRTGFVSVDQAQVFDRSEGAVQANIQNALDALTHDTGGFYANTNDFRSPVRRVLEEVNFHYEVTYSPGIEKYDGHLRKILVKIARPDVRVLTRSGYYAMPPAIPGMALQPYEGPMLNALSMQTLTRESTIPFRAEAKMFGAKTSLVVDVPIEQMALTSDAAAGSFRMHMSVLGLFKDLDGGIVQKVSRDVPAKGKLENLESTRAGHFIFTQHVDLPPGHYTLETAVFDRESLKIGVKKQVVIVPAQAGDLSLSSLSLVRKVATARARTSSQARRSRRS
jgi:VWFA-related protein